jgi:hypothetical protein
MKKNKTIRSKNEDDLHLIIKILLAKKIREEGNVSYVEQEIKGINFNKIVDVVDDTNRIIYEIEKRPSKEYRRKILELSEELNAIGIIIDTNLIPEKIRQSIIDLNRLIKQFVVRK